MTILLIGGNGTIGKRVYERLVKTHKVIIAGKKTGDITFDLEDSSSIYNMFQSLGKLDAIICIAGDAKWNRFELLTEEDYYNGFKNKLMGQINLVRIGKDYINEGGSITLTTGITADEPVPMTAIAAMVNGAIHSFVKAVTLELRNIRINVVCSDLVEDSFEKYGKYFPGHIPVPMKKVVDGYVKCLEGNSGGEILIIKAKE